MKITQTEYILRSISKIRNKKWEFFIVTRIIHSLPVDVEFVTQQLVRLPNGKRALTDLYFPQFDIHLEIDEKHHKSQLIEDLKRERDIIKRTDHSLIRIEVSDENGNDLCTKIISEEVDIIISKILKLRSEQLANNQFAPWDYESRYTAESVIKAGIVSIENNVVFQTQLEALRCFGFKGKGYQRGAWKVPDGTNDLVWFPRLYKHGLWHNELTVNGEKIIERALDNNTEALASISKQIKDEMEVGIRNFIVFAKARDALGFNLYRYVGTFRMNIYESTTSEIVFDKVKNNEKVRVI